MKSLGKATRFLKYHLKDNVVGVIGVLVGVFVFLFLMVVTPPPGPVKANGDGGDNAVSSSEIVIISDNIEMQVKNPLEVFNDSFALNFSYDGGLVDLWPGMQVASGYVTVKNVSPVPYSLAFSAEPKSREAYIQPPFVVTLDKLWDGRREEPWDGKVLQPGQKVVVDIHVSLPYWAEASMPFRGLKLLVKPQAPLVAPVLPGDSG